MLWSRMNRQNLHLLDRSGMRETLRGAAPRSNFFDHVGPIVSPSADRLGDFVCELLMQGLASWACDRQNISKKRQLAFPRCN